MSALSTVQEATQNFLQEREAKAKIADEKRRKIDADREPREQKRRKKEVDQEEKHRKIDADREQREQKRRKKEVQQEAKAKAVDDKHRKMAQLAAARMRLWRSNKNDEEKAAIQARNTASKRKLRAKWADEQKAAVRAANTKARREARSKVDKSLLRAQEAERKRKYRLKLKERCRLQQIFTSSPVNCS
jgi:hypothetical protein